MSFKKEYFNEKKIVKVTFMVPSGYVPGAKSVAVAGEFNGWNLKADLMKKDATGNFTLVKELSIGREYQFRYCADGHYWFNDDNADAYAPTQFNSENSVLDA